MKSQAKKTTELLEKNTDLHFILSKIKQIKVIHTQVLPYLDEQKAYCQIANCVNDQLIIHVPNASIATYLRFKKADLLFQFKQNKALRHIKDIVVKVKPKSVENTTPTIKKMAKLSNSTAKQIEMTAESIEDPQLRKALLKIAQHRESQY